MPRLSKEIVEELLTTAGININGSNPWDIQIHDERFYDRVVSEGTLGLGESYMEGWWDCSAIDQMIDRLVRTKAYFHSHKTFQSLIGYIQARLFNLQSRDKSTVVGKKHYDIGNDLFKDMLDARMTYSCGYWKDAANLNEAQEAKLELICKKIGLLPQMKVLDIGCGWGSFCKYATEQYGVEVVGITISKKQLELAKELCKGLPIELRFQDYRELSEPFDRIVSVGQFEHVGYKNYDTFFDVCHRNLKPEGLFLLHSIGSNFTTHRGDPWIEKYIFPGGALPSISQIGIGIENRFVMEDWHNFSADYDKTLMAWHRNFNAHWNELKHNYDEPFFRMWNFYLLLCAGCFRARYLQLWQVVLSPEGVRGGYESIR